MKATVDTKEFKRIIKALKPFTGLYVNRMQYIRLKINSETQEIKFEALDRHRIAVEYLECKTDTSFTAYIKPFTLISKGKFTEIEKINDKVYITMDEYSFGFKQPSQEWYETENFITECEKEKPVLKVGVNAKLLMDALKNVKQKNGNDLVVIECRKEPNPIIIKSVNDERNIRLVLPVRYKDEGVE